jgi:hypothetical protein
LRGSRGVSALPPPPARQMNIELGRRSPFDKCAFNSSVLDFRPGEGLPKGGH